MKKIKDITLEEIISGKNWKLVTSDHENDLEIVDMFIEGTNNFNEDDFVVYSAILPLINGEAIPLVQIKEVGSSEYGGDFAVYLNGKWGTLGPNFKPDIEVSNITYIANPLDIDPMFEVNLESKEWHRENFRKMIDHIK